MSLRPEVRAEVPQIPRDQVRCPGCRCTPENRPVLFWEIDFSAKLRRQHHCLPNLHFRIGASSLLGDVVEALEKAVTG